MKKYSKKCLGMLLAAMMLIMQTACGMNQDEAVNGSINYDEIEVVSLEAQVIAIPQPVEVTVSAVTDTFSVVAPFIVENVVALISIVAESNIGRAFLIFFRIAFTPLSRRCAYPVRPQACRNV